MYKVVFSLLAAGAAGFLFFDYMSEDLSAEGAVQLGEFADWKPYEPATGKFSVDLPSIPQYAIDVVNVPKTNIKRWYEVYASEELNGTVYLINLITYQPDFELKNTKELLHNVVEEMISSNLNNHILEIKDTNQDGRQAVSFHIENHMFQVKGRAFLVGSTVYLLAYTARNENFSEKEYDKFVTTFQVLKEEDGKTELSNQKQEPVKHE